MKISVAYLDSDIIELENLKNRILGIDKIISRVGRNIYLDRLISGIDIALKCEMDGKIIGGCFLSSSGDSLYIEWIFVDINYQTKGIGSEILNYIEDNLEIFEEYFNNNYSEILLKPREYAMDFYKNRGYTLTKKRYMKKTIKKRNN